MKYLSILCAFFLAGCATIVNGPRQRVPFSSNPSNSKVTVKYKTFTFKKERGKFGNIQTVGVENEKIDECVTPCVLRLPKNNRAYYVTFANDGYESSDIVLYRKPSGWLWGNIIFGWAPGVVVDLATTSGLKIKPESVHADLKKK